MTNTNKKNHEYSIHGYYSLSVIDEPLSSKSIKFGTDTKCKQRNDPMGENDLDIIFGETVKKLVFQKSKENIRKNNKTTSNYQ